MFVFTNGYVESKAEIMRVRLSKFFYHQAHKNEHFYTKDFNN